MRACTSPLLTDLYQLTMMQAYLECGMTREAVFEFFVRKMPEKRSFLLFVGLEQALQFLERLKFSEEELEWLSACGRFSRSFIDYLAELRFTGDVHAMREGTVFFANEPVIRVTAPLPLAQLVETRLINILQYQILVASKAARIVLAAPNKLLVDFGLRRAHEADAGFMAARAAYVAGFAGTSTVLAAPVHDIPIFGTMAHSFIQAHEDESTAFLNFARCWPENAILLIDTYDTEQGAKKAVEVAKKLAKEGIHIRAVRLDSGDLAEHARNVRTILDSEGLREVKIFSSGSLDEYRLRDLLKQGAPIDGFGVGTRLTTSNDVPYLDCAYKLQEYDGIPKRKRSEGKATWPGRKQVYRFYDRGLFSHDVLTTANDSLDGDPLLEPVMVGGELLAPYPPLSAIRSYAESQLSHLPEHLKSIDAQGHYDVVISEALQRLTEEVDRRLAQTGSETFTP